MVGTGSANPASEFHAPGEVLADMLGSARFGAVLGELAEQLERPVDEVRTEAVACLKEMTAGQNRAAINTWTRLGGWMSRAYEVDADPGSLARLREINKSVSLVFLPNHRSYLDPVVLRAVLARAGFPPNHVLGGVNLAFFPLGSVARRSSVVFIRRQFRDDAVYRAMLGLYLAHLVRERDNLEWYIEGGRTRTGKLRPPRMGILSYLVDAFDTAAIDDVLFVPVSIIYDQQHEVGAIAAEEAGGTKVPESVRWLVNYARAQGNRRGRVHVRFAHPVSLRDALTESRARSGSGDVRLAVPKVAFEVCHRINEVTPITASALVTLTLLDNDDRALTEAQMRQAVLPVMKYIRARGLPVASGMRLDQLESLTERSPTEGRATLKTLVREGVVAEYKGGLEPVFSIPAERQLEAAFYRNTMSHFFVTRSILELALVKVAEDDAGDVATAVWQESLRLRDLLKFEFFFSTKREFGAEVRREVDLAYPGWEDATPSADHVLSALTDSGVLLAHRIVAPFLEAYAVLAERLAAADPKAAIDSDALVAECVGIAQQRVLQRTIHSPESVSKDFFRGALRLAANRGIIDPSSPNVAARRADFAAELADAVRRVEVLRTLVRRGQIHG